MHSLLLDIKPTSTSTIGVGERTPIEGAAMNAPRMRANTATRTFAPSLAHSPATILWPRAQPHENLVPTIVRHLLAASAEPIMLSEHVWDPLFLADAVDAIYCVIARKPKSGP
jgi:hypothetical protein